MPRRLRRRAWAAGRRSRRSPPSWRPSQIRSCTTAATTPTAAWRSRSPTAAPSGSPTAAARASASARPSRRRSSARTSGAAQPSPGARRRRRRAPSRRWRRRPPLTPSPSARPFSRRCSPASRSRASRSRSRPPTRCRRASTSATRWCASTAPSATSSARRSRRRGRRSSTWTAPKGTPARGRPPPSRLRASAPRSAPTSSPSGAHLHRCRRPPPRAAALAAAAHPTALRLRPARALQEAPGELTVRASLWVESPHRRPDGRGAGRAD